MIKEFSIQHRQAFIAEVVQTHVSDHLVRESGRQVQIVGLSQLDPIIYTLDNRYYHIGEDIEIGYPEEKNWLSSIYKCQKIP